MPCLAKPNGAAMCIVQREVRQLPVGSPYCWVARWEIHSLLPIGAHGAHSERLPETHPEQRRQCARYQCQIDGIKRQEHIGKGAPILVLAVGLLTDVTILASGGCWKCCYKGSDSSINRP